MKLSRLVLGRVPLERAVELRLCRVLDVEERALAAAEAVRRREYARAAAGGVLGDASTVKTVRAQERALNSAEGDVLGDASTVKTGAAL